MEMEERTAQTIQTKGLKLEHPLHTEDLFFPYEVLLRREGETHSFSIEQQDINSVPDCKIGNFYLNTYMRPDKACKKNFEGYKSIGAFSRAVKACTYANGYIFMGWIEKT
jgi:hypothetical protein